MTDHRRTPADFLTQARETLAADPGIMRDAERGNRESKRALRAMGPAIEGDLRRMTVTGERGVAFQLAVMEAVKRRRRADRACPHVYGDVDELDDLAAVDQIASLSTGHLVCKSCAPRMLPKSGEMVLDHDRCDVCETPSEMFTELVVPLASETGGQLTVYANVCDECAAFQRSAVPTPTTNGNGRHARFEDALDALAHLNDQIRSGRLRGRILDDAHDTTLGALERRASAIIDGLPDDDERVQGATGTLTTIKFMRDSIGRAEPVYVSPDVFDVWRFAAEQFEPEPLDVAEIFATPALVLLPQPVPVADTPCTALLWGLMDLVNGDLMVQIVGFRHTPGGWVFGNWVPLPLGVGYDSWRRSTEELNPDRSDAALHAVGHGAAWRDLQSFWRLARGFVRAPERASRAGRRAAKRAQLVHDTNVTVIRLRRQRHEEPETERDVDWSCRWIVRGHWRRLQDDRQVWVNAHVKGPDDKPLRVTDRVWEFVR